MPGPSSTLHSPQNNSHKVAIIGAGPAGLATARALKQLKIEFDILEKHSDVGGIWNRENHGSPMYRSAHFISSKTQSGHTGFPMPDNYPDYPSNRQILDYIRAFTERYQLKDSIHFNTSVTEARYRDNEWEIQCEDREGNKHTARYRWLVCASGTNWLANRPQLEGEQVFAGEIIHSVDYHDSDRFKGKRVLVVGAGNSGVDIACDAAFAAEQAYISLRRGYHFVPKHIFGMPADVFGAQSKWMPMAMQQAIFGGLLRLLEGDLTRLGLQKPDHKILASHPILNTQILHFLQHGDLRAKPDIDYLSDAHVHFKDGSRTAIDLIVLATGYHWHLPYLNNEYFTWQHNRPQTFLKVFNPKHPSLFINGFIETNGGAYKLFDEMANLIAHTIDAQRKNTKSAQDIQQYIKGAEPDLSGKVRYVPSERHSGYTNSDAFIKAMAALRKTMHWPSAEDTFVT